MAVNGVGEIIQSIGKNFDGNRDGALSGLEKYAFLGELASQLGTREPTSLVPVSTPVRTTPASPLGESPAGTTALTGDVGLNHVTDFLTLRSSDGRTLYTHLYAGYSDGDRAEVRDALKERGYTHIYLYAMNEGDYGGRTVFNGYQSPEQFRARLQELVDDGLAPVVWLAPDDAPTFHKDSAETLPDRWEQFIPAVDDLVASYVVGLEMDEYWSAGEQDRLGRHLDSLTDRPLFVHYTSGEWEGAKSDWVDGLIYQYGFGLSEGDVADRTTQLVSRLHPMGKTFIAGEYAYRVPEAEARRLGAAALRAGADGVGNGTYL
jgi:hypothetical protein